MPTSLRTGDPDELCGYRLAGRLGEGGQGVVYLGEDADGRRVAIKVLHSHRTDDARTRELFLREARAAQRVGPFGTARVLDVGTTDDDLPFIVSEYIEGRSLQQLVEDDGPLSASGLLRLAISTASSLAAIHRAGIVHRDFKPSNVLLALDGPRVIDFGIAGLTEADKATVTGKGEGTPAFMSPEQVNGGRLTTASDVFSWASTLLYAASGRPPFGKDAIVLVLNRILQLEPDLAGLPDELRPLVVRCLAKDPAARPTAQELAVALVSPAGDATTTLPPVAR
ncbi:serine/threonine-protein kinase, partial [Actinocorallia lasiicapitis]